MQDIISKYLSILLVIVFTTLFVLFPDYLVCVKSSAGVNQNKRDKSVLIKKDKLIVNILDSKRDVLENFNEWTILWKAFTYILWKALVEEVLTCAHAHQEYHKSLLVEHTLGVSRPLTCYQCQQGLTTSLEIGNIHHLLHILLYTIKNIDR